MYTGAPDVVRVAAAGKAGATQFMTKTVTHTLRAGPARGKKSSVEVLGPNSEIARKLKQYYHELVSEEIPDRFSDLLKRLEEAEPGDRLQATNAGPVGRLEAAKAKAKG
jgi:hypothetical protein